MLGAFGRKRPPKDGCCQSERRAMSLLSAIGAMASRRVPSSTNCMSTTLPSCSRPASGSASGPSWAWMPAERSASAPAPLSSASARPSTCKRGVPTKPRTSEIPIARYGWPYTRVGAAAYSKGSYSACKVAFQEYTCTRYKPTSRTEGTISPLSFRRRGVCSSVPSRLRQTLRWLPCSSGSVTCTSSVYGSTRTGAMNCCSPALLCATRSTASSR